MKQIFPEEALQKTSQVVENEAYWRKHYELHKASGLSRIQYCRENDVHKDRFSYWSIKFSREKQPLIAVKLKQALPTPTANGLCQVQLANGCQLIIHDLSALALLLDRMS